ncbi:MAG: class I SAM-dependent methyltransferase [Saccharothrix sp.]|nr:class I SAM-dependent methyltransferase [Saccharothrix sp.]
MSWYEDEDLWSAFEAVMFSPDRAESARRLVAGSPLFDFPDGARVLDQCCGRGFFTVPLAGRGYAVTGVDLGAAVLDRAALECERAGVSAELVRSDVLDFVRPGAFDVVVNLATCLGYFDRHEDNVQVLRNAHESLAPGGQLVVDLLGKEIYAGWAGTPKAVAFDGGVVHLRDTVLDDWTRCRSELTLVRGDTAVHGSVTCYCYSAAELRAMFEEVGFTGVECFGNFDGGPYDNHATRLIVRGTRAA